MDALKIKDAFLFTAFTKIKNHKIITRSKNPRNVTVSSY